VNIFIIYSCYKKTF